MNKQLKNYSFPNWNGLVWHVTSVANLQQILGQGMGLLPKNMLIEQGINYSDISELQVQQRRASRIINGHSIHEYVPTFFVQRNPMMYVRKNMARQLVWLGIKPSTMDQRKILTSDGNAASLTTSFRQGIDLEHPDWAVLQAPAWNEIFDGRRKRAAELLCLGGISTSHIVELHVCDARLVLPLRNSYGLPVYHNPSAFFC